MSFYGLTNKPRNSHLKTTVNLFSHMVMISCRNKSFEEFFRAINIQKINLIVNIAKCFQGLIKGFQ